MQGISIDVNLVHFMLVIMVVMLVIQAYVLIRIRNVLQAVAMNFDSIIYFLRRFLNQKEKAKTEDTEKIQMAKTCQFCKHRLAYINTSQTSENEENFYYRCGLCNINVALSDSCVHFEKDQSTPIDDNNDLES